MTVEEFNKRLSSFEKGVVTEIYKAIVTKKTGLDIESTVRERVMMKSTSGDGTKFSAYSTKPMLTSGTTAKGSNVWRGKKDKKWVTVKNKGKNVHLFVLEGGYAELRRLENFNNQYKNFWFRGGAASMWSNFGMVDKNITKDGFTIVYKGKKPEAQDIIDKQSEREGKSIIAMTKGEIQNISDRVSKIIDKDLKKNKI